MQWKRFFGPVALLLPLLAFGVTPEPKDPFDRLDGVGPSRMNVRVIDWAGNIELQISPMNKVKMLSFKIDRETSKDRPVLVIEYQWKHLPYRQIRRALLTTPLKEDFKVYYDASYGDRDRFILTNHTPEKKGLLVFVPGPEPTQIWPDHHENLGAAKAPAATAEAARPAPSTEFTPYSTDEAPRKRVVSPDPVAERPATYGKRQIATPGVQFQQTQVEQSEQGTVRRRNKVEFQPSELSQGFDF